MRISPDSSALAIIEFVTAAGNGGNVVILDRNGKELTRTRVTNNSTEGLAWSPSGAEIWYAGAIEQGWSDTIYGLARDGKQRIVFRLPGMLRLHDVSRDGRILLTREIWRDEVQFRGPGDSRERSLSWLDYATVDDLSNDGSLLAMEDWGEAAGASALGFIRKTDGSPAVKLGAWAALLLSPDN